MSVKSSSSHDLRSTNRSAIQEEPVKVDYDVAYAAHNTSNPDAADDNSGHGFRKGWMWTVVNHIQKHTGVGIICAVAYFDPGNWGVDLQAGSQYGYKLLFIVLLAGLLAVFLQVLAVRLGCVTGLDLASHCRLLLHSRPKHTLFYRWVLLYPLYVLSEIAIIATDLAELLGSAMAICMLIPACPLWVGVVVTGADVFFLLALGNPLGTKPMKSFEYLIAVLVLAVLICMCIVVSRVDVGWGQCFKGYLPNKTAFSGSGMYVSVGILGATVMPHSLFLGSALATQDREALKEQRAYGDEEDEDLDDLKVRMWSMEWVRAIFRPVKSLGMGKGAKDHKDWRNNSYDFVKRHVYHGTVDMVISLLGFAVVINSLILILAAAVFFYGNDQTPQAAPESPASLFDAFDLIRTYVGKPAAYLFAIALLASGQSSSIIATIAGQAVSEGFLNWKVSPIMRRMLTRLLALIPSLIVAVVVGRSGVDTLLVASQVCLSIVLPFIVFPLLWLTNSKEIMSVQIPRRAQAPMRLDTGTMGSRSTFGGNHPPSVTTEDVESIGYSKVHFSNGWPSIIFGYTVWLVVVAANIYALVLLGQGNT